MARIGDQVAAIIGAPAGSVLLKQNVTDLVSAIASALDFGGSRNRVVMSDLEWPSSGYLWHEHRASAPSSSWCRAPATACTLTCSGSSRPSTSGR